MSIGISYNKVFAKLGSEYGDVDSITVINRENKANIVDRLPASELLNVGKKTALKLKELNIHTIGDLAAASPDVLKQYFGKAGTTLHIYANGMDNSDVIETENKPKSIGNSTTPTTNMCTDQDVYLVMCVLCQSVATRLKKHNLKGRCITVSTRTTDLIWNSFQTTLKHNTNLYHDFLKQGFSLFKSNCDLKEPLRSIGISVSQLIDTNVDQQLELFEQPEKEELYIIENTIDSIRNRFGYKAIDYAVTKLNRELTDFSPSSEKLSYPGGNKSETKSKM